MHYRLSYPQIEDAVAMLISRPIPVRIGAFPIRNGRAYDQK